MISDADFEAVLKAFGLLWSGYRKVRKGAKRRLASLMAEQGIPTIPDLLECCRESPALKEEALRALAVPISRFFRDRRLWIVLETHVIPGIARWSGNQVRVWSAGCARGEETYTIKILYEELASRCSGFPSLALWATDFHSRFLEAASHGVFHRSSLKEVPIERRTAWFSPLHGDLYAVSQRLKEGILWMSHDLTRDEPPASGFHLIFLRHNLLTYYARSVQEKAFSPIVESLLEGGFLILGCREKPPPGMWPLMRCAADPHIYRKVPFFSRFRP